MWIKPSTCDASIMVWIQPKIRFKPISAKACSVVCCYNHDFELYFEALGGKSESMYAKDMSIKFSSISNIYSNIKYIHQYPIYTAL